MHSTDFKLNAIIGSNIGTLKHVEYNPNSKKKLTTNQLQDINELKKGEGITCMTWYDDKRNKVIIGRTSEIIQTYDFITNQFEAILNVDFGDKKLNSISKIDNIIVGSVSSGIVKIWDVKSDTESIIETAGPIDRMKYCNEDVKIIATGGKENELKLWDIETKSTTFHAKNVPHDWLQLRVPVWVSDISFLPESAGKLIATCSRYGYIRLYDARAQRRPVCNIDFKDQAGSCITPGFREKHVIVGTGRGLLNLVDLRKAGKLDKSYKGAVGAITEVFCIKEHNVVASASLDRHFRIHHAETKEVIHKQYLTTKLTCFLVKDISPITECEGDVYIKEEVNDVDVKEDVTDEEYENLFENMEIIKEKVRPNKKIDTMLNGSKLATPKSNKKRKAQQDGQPSDEVVSKITKLDDKPEITYDALLEEKIKKLLKSTERQKRKYLNEKKRKRAKSIFFN